MYYIIIKSGIKLSYDTKLNRYKSIGIWSITSGIIKICIQYDAEMLIYFCELQM